MTVHYLPGYLPTTSGDASKSSASKEDTHGPGVTGRNALSNALAVTQRSPGWNNRKPDVQRVQLGACTLLAVPYRRWAWRRYELRVAEQRRREA
jgi:hypothetical protein